MVVRGISYCSHVSRNVELVDIECHIGFTYPVQNELSIKFPVIIQ